MNKYLLWFLIIISILLRFLPHGWNISPVVGIGLFCGAYLPARKAFVVSFLSMAVGDFLLGWVPVNLFGWIAIAASILIGLSLRENRSFPKIVGASLAGSTLFFLISNFGVWFLGCGHGWYPASVDGLLRCYLAGVPFYRNSLAGDLLYTGILFGSFELLTRGIFRRSHVKVAVSK